MTQSPILVALPNDAEMWAEGAPLVCQYLEEHGYECMLVSSKSKALNAIKTLQLRAIVMLSDWAQEIELIEHVKGEIPTVCLISSETWKDARESWFDELFHPPYHEYASIPVSMEQLISRLEYVITAFDSKGA